MKISTILARLLAVLGLTPHYVVDGDGGAVIDRGDSFTPTDDDAPNPDPKNPDPDDDGEGDTTDKAKPKDAPKDEPKDDPKPKGKAIPLDRHEAILNREREARQRIERELAEARGAKEVAKTNEQLTALETEVLALEEKYTKLMVDGEAKEAARVMAEIRGKERTISEARVQFQSQAAEARAYERARYDAIVDRIEEAYPQLREGSDDYDEDLADSVMTMATGLQARHRLTRGEALQRAVAKLLPQSTQRQTKAVETDARPSAEAVAAKLAEERKAAAVKRNASDAAKTPADTSRIGLDSDKAGGKLDPKAVMRMSQDEFAKLDEETLSKLRGDTL